MPWVIVTFTSTNEVEAIPEKWYNENLNIVYYPNFDKKQDIQKAIKNESEPDLKKWIPYDVTIFHNRTYHSFVQATAKASKACHVSDISEAEQALTKRIPKKKYSVPLIHQNH